MEIHLQPTWILVVPLMTISAAQATTQTFYNVAEPMESLKGKILKEFKTRYKIQCSERLVYETNNKYL